MKFILVRHGQTNQNIIDNLGNAGNNEPLNATGILQAAKAAKDITRFKPKYIFSSDMLRTIQTANYIKKQSPYAQIIAAKALREFNMGDWSFKNSEELANLISNDKKWHNGRPSFDWQAPNGESWKIVKERISQLFDVIEKDYKDTHNLVLVSHNQTLRAIRGLLLELPFDQWFSFKPENGSVTIIEKS